jgi:hypothetical protein
MRKKKYGYTRDPRTAGIQESFVDAENAGSEIILGKELCMRLGQVPQEM